MIALLSIVPLALKGSVAEAPRAVAAWPRDARSPVDVPLFAVGYGQCYTAPVELDRLPEDPGDR